MVGGIMMSFRLKYNKFVEWIMYFNVIIFCDIDEMVCNTDKTVQYINIENQAVML